MNHPYQRVIIGQATDVTATFEDENGDPFDLDAACTVTVVHADGTTRTATATHTTTGVYTLRLSGADVALLDTLTLTWAGLRGGAATQIVTTVDVAGGFLFSIAQARATKQLGDLNKYSTGDIAAARVLAEQAFEEAANVAFVPRYATETLTGTSASRLFVRWNRIRTVRTVTIDAAAVTGTDLAGIKPLTSRGLYYSALWSSATPQNVTVGYEHGFDRPPLRVANAVLMLAKNWLLSGPISDRATGMSTPDGETFSWLVPGVRGVRFGIPEVDAALLEHGYPDPVL